MRWHIRLGVHGWPLTWLLRHIRLTPGAQFHRFPCHPREGVRCRYFYSLDLEFEPPWRTFYAQLTPFNYMEAGLRPPRTPEPVLRVHLLQTLVLARTIFTRYLEPNLSRLKVTNRPYLKT